MVAGPLTRPRRGREAQVVAAARRPGSSRAEHAKFAPGLHRAESEGIMMLQQPPPRGMPVTAIRQSLWCPGDCLGTGHAEPGFCYTSTNVTGAIMTSTRSSRLRADLREPLSSTACADASSWRKTTRWTRICGI